MSNESVAEETRASGKCSLLRRLLISWNDRSSQLQKRDPVGHGDRQQRRCKPCFKCTLQREAHPPLSLQHCFDGGIHALLEHDRMIDFVAFTAPQADISAAYCWSKGPPLGRRVA